MTDEELMYCPFCGSTVIDIYGDDVISVGLGLKNRIVCRHCKASTGSKKFV